MSYDPYGQQGTGPEQGGGNSFSPGGILSGYLKFKYLQTTGAWSGSKGVALPFGATGEGSIWRSAVSEVYGAFKGEKGFFKSIHAAGRAAIGQKKYLFNKTNRVFGYDNFTEEIKSVNSRINLSKRAIKGLESQRSAAINIKERIISQQEGFSLAGGRGKSNYRPFRKEWHQIQNKIEKLEGRLAVKKSYNTALTREAERLGAKKFAMGLAKWGIRGMKGVGAIGLITMMYDFGSMVGRPVGELLINTINTAAQRYEDRFSTNMGGKINAAYMSYGAATERQRAVSAISKAYINGRSAYGSEASMMHS